MARVERRLRKLQARLTDRTRLIPYTVPWFDYWTARLDQLMNCDPVDEKMPIKFLDVLIARAYAPIADVCETPKR